PPARSAPRARPVPPARVTPSRPAASTPPPVRSGPPAPPESAAERTRVAEPPRVLEQPHVVEPLPVVEQTRIVAPPRPVEPRPATEQPRATATTLPPARRPRSTPVDPDDEPTVQLEAVDAGAPSGTPEQPEGPTDSDAPQRAAPKPAGKTAGLSRLALSKRRRRSRLALAGRTVVAFASVLALVGTGGVWGYVRSTEAGFSQIAALDTESTDIVDPVGQTGDETYLIVGTDTRAGASGSIGAGTVEDAEGARADTVILVNIPADRSRVVAVSFPRDLDVERPVCRGWDSVTGDYESDLYPAADGDKLNATYALGGPKCLVKVIQKMSGLKIGHFVGIDFAGFESMVDGIGGVEVCTSVPLVDGELGTILPTAGRQMLDGRQSLDYVRARKVEAEGNGDYGRIARQQKFLSSLLRSALSNKVLLDPGKLNNFINAFTQATFVENVNTESLVKLGRSLQNVDAGAVTFLTVPTDGTNDWGNEIPRLDDIKAIFQAIIDDEPLPGEKREEPAPADSAAGAAAAPQVAAPEVLPAQESVDTTYITLQVSNASGEAGLAARTAESLGAYGYSIYAVGNYSGTSSQTVVRFTPGQEAQAATVASMIPGAVLQQLSSSADRDGIVELVLGSDFAGTIAEPQLPGTLLEPVRVEQAPAGEIELPGDLAVTNAGDDSCG
ncbi:LCP family protein, partial [Rhodococcus phenolicus]|uniref:LCP family protein n=1 Tax=Rhodococcus phenolicus TaxID=263849 RepID=UPI003CCC39D0